jgi:ferritin-like metal-binding protein YciE
MEPETLVRRYLEEAHALETALVTTLGAHIAMTSDPDYRALLERHLGETRDQVKALERRLRSVGGSRRGVVGIATGIVRTAVGQALVLTKGPLDLLRTPDQRERMLKNAKDECVTEALEIATYDVLEAVAKAAGDRTTARLAAEHRKQEQRMLADLRAQIAALSVETFESQTDETAKPQAKSAATREAETVNA